MIGRLLVYGATGYTGQLVARRAVEIGLDVVVAGRDPSRVAALADELASNPGPSKSARRGRHSRTSPVS